MISVVNIPISDATVDLDSDKTSGDTTAPDMRDRIYDDPLKFLGDTLRDLVDAKESKMADMMDVIQDKILLIEKIQKQMSVFYTQIVKDLSTDGKKSAAPGGYNGWNELFQLIPELGDVHPKDSGSMNYFQLNTFREYVNSKCSSIQNEIDKENNEVNRELQKMDSAKQNYIENLKSIVNISMR